MNFRMIACTACAFGAGLSAAQAQNESVTVTGRSSNLIGIAGSANQGTIGASDMALRPLLRPGEIVENIPGVIVTQHSGSGKANQYFLRGFNLDHGGDLAITLDGMPVNNVSHGHAHGYADLNFAIPELIEAVDFKKGPYYANVGDFGAAGAFDIRYYKTLPDGIVSLDADVGEHPHIRAVIADNIAISSSNAIAALSLEYSNGPWILKEDARKISGMLRYTEGAWTLSAMAYHNVWLSTDQVPRRAIASGLIDRFGNIDPTDLGRSGRYSVSAAWNQQDNNSRTSVMVYGMYYDVTLIANFTYFLDDPVNGDQFAQQDARWEFGSKASHEWIHELFGRNSTTSVGADLRFDTIQNGLFKTQNRVRIGTTGQAHVAQTSISPYLQNETSWTPWLRTIFGARADAFWFDVTDKTGAGNEGSKSAVQASPKIGIVLGPWERTELYLNYGDGYHSNDARAQFAPAGAADPFSRTTGMEVGVRTSIIPGLQSSVSLWQLDIQSELKWVGDSGTTEPAGRTRRWGIELANFYTPTDWMTVDLDYAWSHARFADFDPAGQFIPESLAETFDGGFALHDLDGWAQDWSAGLRLRYFGPRALTQDNSVRSEPTTLLYANVGYDITDNINLTLSVFNLLDTEASDIDYYYTSRLPGEPAGGVDDIHTHPSEPREIRLTLKAKI